MMEYLAWIIFGLTIMQLLVALSNLIFFQDPGKTTESTDHLVSILIPARNEEKNIGTLLQDLLDQDYSNFEIIVFNDMSEDGTADIVERYVSGDGRIRMVNSLFLPEGWTGKNWACHNLAKEANGSFILFLDADVRIGRGVIREVLSFSDHFGLSLMSMFPRQIMLTRGEKTTVPVMNYILLSLLPLILVRKSEFRSLAAANGQFMLFRAEAYKRMIPHEKMKNSLVEDIEIARYFKAENETVACLAGKESLSCRMYSNYHEAVNGFSKNVLSFFGNSAVAAVGFWFLTTFGFIFIIVYLPLFLFLIWFASYLLTRIIISVVSRQKIVNNLLFIVQQQLALGLFIYNALVVRYKGSYKWKDREI